VSSYVGGNSAQMLVNAMADKISKGELSSVVCSGCEDMASLTAALGSDEDKDALAANWIDARPEDAPPVRVGPEYIETPMELKHGLQVPVRSYPLFEQAMRAHRGGTVEEHMLETAKMFSGLSEVAAEQPEHAWFPTAHSPEEMVTATATNRWVGYPYTKYMVAAPTVDMAASVILMSVAEARRRGIAEEKMIYLHGCADTIEKEILKRPELHRSPAMHSMGQQLAAAANVDLQSDIKFKDIYSCFPVAVSVLAQEFGLPCEDGRDFTLTGGLPYHGGPGSNCARARSGSRSLHL